MINLVVNSICCAFRSTCNNINNYRQLENYFITVKGLTKYSMALLPPPILFPLNALHFMLKKHAFKCHAFSRFVSGSLFEGSHCCNKYVTKASLKYLTM